MRGVGCFLLMMDLEMILGESENSRKTYKHDIAGIKFAHNKGHQNAVYTGLMQAKISGCDCAISMDARFAR